jgi:hypothetical protein
LADLGVDIVRLEVFDDRIDELLATVDVTLPRPIGEPPPAEERPR